MKTVLAVVESFESLVAPEEAATLSTKVDIVRSVRNNVVVMKNATTITTTTLSHATTSVDPSKEMFSNNANKTHADEQTILPIPPPNALVVSPRAIADSPTSSGQAISVASTVPARRRKKLAVRKNHKVTKHAPPFPTIPRITTTSKSDQHFRDRLQDLKDFKALHGHCNTTYSASGNNQLYKWCSAIRKSYLLLGSGVRAPIVLTEDRVDALWKVGLLLEETKKQAPKISPKKEKKSSTTRSASSKAKVSQYEQHASDSHVERDQETRNNAAKKGKKTASATISTEGKKSYQQRAFDTHMEQLKEFMKEYGHSRVPSDYNVSHKLRDWCYQIRYSYRRMKMGFPPHYRLNSKRIAELNAIGFDFEVEYKSNIPKKSSKPAGTAPNAKRNTRGHSRITPKQTKSEKDHYSPDIVPSSSTRACAVTSSGEGSNDAEGKPNLATSAIGTTAQKKTRAKCRSFYEAFRLKVEAFKEYKRLNGHQNLRRKENKTLYDWCYRVQSAYAQKRLGAPMCLQLSDERETILRAAGFKFDVETNKATYIASISTQCTSSVEVVTSQKNAANKKTHVARRSNTRHLRSTRIPDQVSRDDQQFLGWIEQLKTYKKKHGNCDINRDDMGLFTWCSEIRKSYSQEGGSSPLTDGKIHALQELGFLFTNETLETGDCSIQQVKSITQMKERSAHTRREGDNDDVIRKSKRSRTSIQTRKGEFDWGVKAAADDSNNFADNDDVKLSKCAGTISPEMMVCSNATIVNGHHTKETTARKSNRKRKGPAAKYGD